MSIVTFSQDLALQIYQSEKQYPVDFDDAWQWLDYSSKYDAKISFKKCGFVKDLDFVSFQDQSGKPQGGRPTEKITITVEAFKSWAMMSSTEKGKQVRLYFLECEKIAKNSTKVVSTPSGYELIAMLAQQGIEQEKRISNLELKIDSFEARTKEATESLKGIEEPSEPAPELSTRAKINRLVREYSIGNGMEFRFVWRMLYREFRDRHGIDLHIRAKNQKTTALDLAESMGLMESLYAVGYSLLTA